MRAKRILCLAVALLLFMTVASADWTYNAFTGKFDYYEPVSGSTLGTLSDITFTGIARGDIIYRGATVWLNLTAGAVGEVLTMGANDPTWVAPGAPGAHAASHEVGGTDLVDHDQLTNYLAAQHLTLPNTIAAVLTDHNLAAHTNTIGGTGVDSSGWSDYVYVTAGAWAVDPTLGHNASGLDITANADTANIILDGANLNIRWSDGNFIAQTDEGANTESIFQVIGKGTGAGQIYAYDTDADTYVGFSWPGGDDAPNLTANADLDILWAANDNVNFFTGALSGENPIVGIHGYVTAGAAVRTGTLQIDEGNDEFVIGAENNANLEGVTVDIPEANQRFRVRQAGAAEVFSVTVAGHTYMVSLDTPWTDVFVVDAGGGGDYTTIQAALTAQAAGGETFLVAPGIYADTIHFTANDQVVKPLGLAANVIVTQADANIVDGGAFTDCIVEGIEIRLTAPTTAINAIQVGTGTLIIFECRGYLATAVALAAVNQPSLAGFTAAGTMNIKRGRYEYYHTGNTGGTGVKAAFRVNQNLAYLHMHKVDLMTITNSGTALVTSIFSSIGTAVVEMHNVIECTVTDPNATYVIGLGYFGGGGVHNLQGNHVNVVVTANTGYGLWHGGTSAIRSAYNAIHAQDTGGASYAFYIGASATLCSHFDDLRSDDGNNITAGGVLEMVSSETDGELSIWGYITADTLPHYVIMDMDDTNDEFEIEAQNNAYLEGVTVYLEEEGQAFRTRGTTRGISLETYPNNALGTILNIYETGTARFSSIQQSTAEGIATSSDLRFGVDESSRNIIGLDRLDIGTDLALAASTHLRFYLYDNTPTNYSYRDWGNLVASSTFEINSTQFTNSITADLAAGDMFTFDSETGDRLIDANAEQAIVKVDGQVEQTSTATWYGDWIDMVITTEGDGSTGFGNKYLLRTESDTEKFSVGPDSDLTGATVDFGGLYMDSINESMIDSGKLDLKGVGAGVGGFGFIVAGDNEAYAYFSFTAAGVVTLISQNNCTTTEDNDTTFNIFDSGAVMGLNNELGATKTVIGYVMYIPD